MIGGIYFGPLAQRIFEALAAAPSGLSRRRLHDEAYASCDIPDFSYNAIRVSIHNFNKKCSRIGLGLRIKASHLGRGARWQIRIVRVEK